ncbi:hypothetical protein PVAND_008784 [Polypedilum vanderplanki]|uniref:Serine protease n=1 Tax=Polypedilum vanderplanki TaxID=319348 RepID=A0A9J6CBB6_POLVA|nr:hypothetical protein PVAND_008784 [Polypedilum vanderplanki]
MVAMITFVLIFLGIFKISFSQVTLCGQTTNINFGQTLTINWPESNNQNTWCGYIIKSPPDTYIRATLTINMQGTEPGCSANQYVAVSIDNMPNWDGYSIFCGTKSPFVVSSIGNEIKFGINANDFSQRVQIQLQVIRLQQGDCQCSWNPSTRIVNGQDAGPNTFTSHVTFNSQGSNFCGGTLITQYHALTAGHCIANINSVYGLSSVIMYVGRYNIHNSVTSDTVYSEAYYLSSAVAHQSYNNPINSNDIGIVTTRNYVRFTRGVSPACIPFAYQGYSLSEGTTLVAVGFGSTEFALNENYDSKSWKLQRVNLQTNSKLASDCSGTVFCTVGYLSGRQDAGPNTFTSHVTFNSQGSNFCGGTLITQYHALTAGHCIANINSVYGLSSVIMYVGRYNIHNSVTSDTVYSEAYYLSSAVAHQSYNNPINSNDIGIVTTRNYVRFTRGVSPACIPFAYQGYSLSEGTTLVPAWHSGPKH